MRKVGRLLAACLILLLATSMTGPYATKLIVEPGLVHQYKQNIGPEHTHAQHDPLHTDPQDQKIPVPTLITGSVMLKESRWGSESETASTGGGCLIYRTPNSKDCTDDSWCPLGGDGARSDPDIGQGYCTYISDVAELIMMGKVKKGCWYKPEPESCVRKPQINDPLPLTSPLDFDRPTPIHPPGVKGPIYWRVVSCQNLVAKGCKDLIPGGFVHRYGPIEGFR